MKFRLILQPAVAIFFAILDGLKDSREGNAPYLWALFTEPERRKPLLLEGWQARAKVFCLAGSHLPIVGSQLDSFRGCAVYCRCFSLCSLSVDSRLINRLMRMTGKIADGSTETGKH